MRSIRERILKGSRETSVVHSPPGCSEVDPGEDTESASLPRSPRLAVAVAVRSIRERILKAWEGLVVHVRDVVAVRSIRERILKDISSLPRGGYRRVAVRSIRERILKAAPPPPAAGGQGRVAVRSIRERILKERNDVRVGLHHCKLQ